MVTQQERAERFRQLHEDSETFIIPNPWDSGSARLLEGLGFKALATTSSGRAFALGRSDGDVSRDEHLAHIRVLCEVTRLPVSADLENCYADDPEEAAKTIQMACEAGAAGCSIEDYSGHDSGRIYEFDHSVERVEAAAEAARKLPMPFVLTARAENLIRNRPDLDDTIKRLQAFEAAGADVLYAPGLKTVDEVKAVCSAVSKPVNVLATPTLTYADIAGAGGKRISLGGALARTAIGGMLDAAQEILDTGAFAPLGDAPSFAEINSLMNGSG